MSKKCRPTPELSGAAGEASYKAESVFRVRLNGGLGDEPDLDFPIHPDYPNVTWRSKKEFCKFEAENYCADGEPMDSNPYIENTWPWKWFNDAYLHADRAKAHNA